MASLVEWVSAISREFRRKRMARFVAEFGVSAETRILDVGGVTESWAGLRPRPRVTLLNMPRAFTETCPEFCLVAGDGRRLPFADGSFDVVFSNSVIEHVGDAASQALFAQEVARVGRGYWVQTPNRWFPVEQHLLTPVIHWLPKKWQRALVPRWTVWGLLARVSADQREFYLAHYLSDARLLGRREMQSFFPEARVIRERCCGLTKSLVAVSSTPPGPRRRRALREGPSTVPSDLA